MIRLGGSFHFLCGKETILLPQHLYPVEISDKHCIRMDMCPSSEIGYVLQG